MSRDITGHCANSHSFYAVHVGRIKTGEEIGKDFDEVVISYPEKDEYVTEGMFYCNRLGCPESFETHRDRK